MKLVDPVKLFDYEPLYAALADSPAAPWLGTLPATLEAALAPKAHGDLPEWMAALAQIPRHRPSQLDLTAPAVRIGGPDDLSETERDHLEQQLRAFHPWRKGPFEVFGIAIDTEWRSDWKWARVAPHLAPLEGRRILDVGCGNGYYGWRMAGLGADLVVGVDPTLRFVMQYHALQRLMAPAPANFVLPLPLEAVPENLAAFDTVFTMGVLYHRRDPLEHLQRVRGCLRPGGELVLETLIIEGSEGELLIPDGRYAKMRNVWSLPTLPTLEGWLRESGFANIRTVDVTPTTTAEQRQTDWMHFHSLAQFLDPADPTRTVEGYPAPVRAVVIANR